MRASLSTRSGFLLSVPDLDASLAIKRIKCESENLDTEKGFSSAVEDLTLQMTVTKDTNTNLQILYEIGVSSASSIATSLSKILFSISNLKLTEDTNRGDKSISIKELTFDPVLMAGQMPNSVGRSRPENRSILSQFICPTSEKVQEMIKAYQFSIDRMLLTQANKSEFLEFGEIRKSKLGSIETAFLLVKELRESDNNSKNRSSENASQSAIKGLTEEDLRDSKLIAQSVPHGQHSPSIILRRGMYTSSRSNEFTDSGFSQKSGNFADGVSQLGAKSNSFEGMYEAKLSPESTRPILSIPKLIFDPIDIEVKRSFLQAAYCLRDTFSSLNSVFDVKISQCIITTYSETSQEIKKGGDDEELLEIVYGNNDSDQEDDEPETRQLGKANMPASASKKHSQHADFFLSILVDCRITSLQTADVNLTVSKILSISVCTCLIGDYFKELNKNLLREFKETETSGVGGASGVGAGGSGSDRRSSDYKVYLTLDYLENLPRFQFNANSRLVANSICLEDYLFNLKSSGHFEDPQNDISISNHHIDLNNLVISVPATAYDLSGCYLIDLFQLQHQNIRKLTSNSLYLEYCNHATVEITKSVRMSTLGAMGGQYMHRYLFHLQKYVEHYNYEDEYCKLLKKIPESEVYTQVFSKLSRDHVCYDSFTSKLMLYVLKLNVGGSISENIATTFNIFKLKDWRKLDVRNFGFLEALHLNNLKRAATDLRVGDTQFKRDTIVIHSDEAHASGTILTLLETINYLFPEAPILDMTPFTIREKVHPYSNDTHYRNSAWDNESSRKSEIEESIIDVGFEDLSQSLFEENMRLLSNMQNKHSIFYGKIRIRVIQGEDFLKKDLTLRERDVLEEIEKKFDDSSFRAEQIGMVSMVPTETHIGLKANSQIINLHEYPETVKHIRMPELKSILICYDGFKKESFSRSLKADQQQSEMKLGIQKIEIQGQKLVQDPNLAKLFSTEFFETKVTKNSELGKEKASELMVTCDVSSGDWIVNYSNDVSMFMLDIVKLLSPKEQVTEKSDYLQGLITFMLDNYITGSYYKELYPYVNVKLRTKCSSFCINFTEEGSSLKQFRVEVPILEESAEVFKGIFEYYVATVEPKILNFKANGHLKLSSTVRNTPLLLKMYNGYTDVSKAIYQTKQMGHYDKDAFWRIGSVTGGAFKDVGRAFLKGLVRGVNRVKKGTLDEKKADQYLGKG